MPVALVDAVPSDELIEMTASAFLQFLISGSERLKLNPFRL
jgi:hypothetical protein